MVDQMDRQFLTVDDPLRFILMVVERQIRLRDIACPFFLFCRDTLWPRMQDLNMDIPALREPISVSRERVTTMFLRPAETHPP
jgi:hypothetical protein